MARQIVRELRKSTFSHCLLVLVLYVALGLSFQFDAFLDMGHSDRDTLFDRIMHLACSELSGLHLDLRWTLRDVFEQCRQKDIFDKRLAVEKAFRNSWTNSLVPLHVFVSKKDEACDMKKAALVIRSGPFNVLVLDLVAKDDHVTLLHGFKTQPREMFFDDMEELLVSKAVPVALCDSTSSMGLAWKVEGYVELKEWIADHCMTKISAGLLIKVCSRLKVHNHSKLDHRHRVELFLRFMGRSDEFIAAVLAALPEKPKRKKKEAR